MIDTVDMSEKLKLGLADILKPIEGYLKSVDEEIKLQLHTGIPVLDDSAFHLFEKGGKKIRASLVVLSSGLRDEPPDTVTEIAAAAEIVHCASLIHDDIIDNSSMRRGVATVSAKWGNNVAVLVGDYMYTRALDISMGESKRNMFPILVSAATDMVKGELYQIEYSNIDKISKTHYFTIIELKTARFMAACMKMGGSMGMMSDDECGILYSIGLNLGFAFQIVDDTLDVMDDRETTGKDGGNDFIEGKITLPLLHMLESVEPAERQKLMAYMKEPDRENWEIVKKKVEETDAVRFSLDVADRYTQKVYELLDALPASCYKDVIRDLSKFLVERSY